MNTLATNYDLFLVAFIGLQEQYIFTGNPPETLGNLIQEHNRHGIDFIKRFDKSKSSFKTISKATVKNLFGYDTHTMVQLQKINFIK